MEPVRLGNHELLIRLASGGAANVFLVRDLAANQQARLLALKILLPSLASNEDFLNMFFTEARIAARLRHKNVVAITGFGQVSGIHCLAMEYVFGPSLSQVLRASARAKKPLTVGVLLRITACVCDALNYAHELRDERGDHMGLVHRDVTPQNILIGFNGVPKLTDFGIAKATGRGWETQAGIVKGKFSYMSPEQALGKKVDRRSDIFGTGIVLWEALTGRDLFKGSTPMEVLTAIREQKIDPPSKVVPGLTPIVDPIVMKALRRSPRARYQTAAEMRDEIEDLIRRAGVDISAQTISREFAAIYGKEIAERAFALRNAMAGRADLEELSRVLGGQVLNPKHLPVIPGGVTDPDPLGLFADQEGSAENFYPAQSVMPARTEQHFNVSPPPRAHTDFEIVEQDEGIEEISRLEPEPNELPLRPIDDNENSMSEWNQSTAAPDDELLSMLSEEDATIGLLPKEFAERFGAELRRAQQEAAEEQQASFGEEATIGMPDGAELAPVRYLSDDDSSRSWSTQYPEPRMPSRPVPRAPSLEMAPSAATRPFPRAPSLDMDFNRGRGVKPPPPPPELIPDLRELDPDITAAAPMPELPIVRDGLAPLETPEEPASGSMPGQPVMTEEPLAQGPISPREVQPLSQHEAEPISQLRGEPLLPPPVEAPVEEGELSPDQIFAKGTQAAASEPAAVQHFDGLQDAPPAVPISATGTNINTLGGSTDNSSGRPSWGVLIFVAIAMYAAGLLSAQLIFG